MKKIKSFFKKVFNLIVSLFLVAVDFIPYIFAVIALYQNNYLIALFLIFFGIAMEIKKGFSKHLKISKDEIAFSVLKQLRREIMSNMKKVDKNEKSN